MRPGGRDMSDLHNMVAEQSAKIARLRAEVERLTRERDAAQEEYERTYKAWLVEKTLVDKAEAEVERLRWCLWRRLVGWR